MRDTIEKEGERGFDEQNLASLAVAVQPIGRSPHSSASAYGPAMLAVPAIGKADVGITQRSLEDHLLPHITAMTAHESVVEREADEAVRRYGFAKFAPVADSYPSRVISMAEFQEHPERYIHKLSKGFLDFPIGLDVEEANKILERCAPNIEIDKTPIWSNNGHIAFTDCIFGGGYNINKDALKSREVLLRAVEKADLQLTTCKNWVHMDPFDFLTNYNGLIQFIEEQPIGDKQKGVRALETARFIYLTALEIAATTNIRNTEELLTDQPNGDEGEGNPVTPKQHIRAMLLAKPKGTTEQELQMVLPLRSKEEFRRLAMERTAEHFPDGRYAGKDFRELSVGESIVLASTFARKVIQQYQNIEDAVAASFAGKKTETVSGKCTDFSGLALHYLREYLIPLNPERFRNWHFGFETEVIGDYRHCYVKAVHVKPDMVDVYFVDPTALAKQGVEGLRTPENVVKIMGTSNHPILIQRDAEDFLNEPQSPASVLATVAQPALSKKPQTGNEAQLPAVGEVTYTFATAPQSSTTHTYAQNSNCASPSVQPVSDPQAMGGNPDDLLNELIARWDKINEMLLSERDPEVIDRLTSEVLEIIDLI